jgi:GTPase SAR1 family protein
MQQEADSQLHKLLLLGAGESGKSTLFKQMVSMYGTEQKDEKKRNLEKKTVFNNVIVNAQTLSEATNTWGEPQTDAGIEARDFIDELAESQPVTPEIATQLKAFWNDPGVQACYDQRSNYQLNDSTSYFMKKLDAIAAPGYFPDQDDVVRTRVRTTGIVEHKFDIDGNPFKMFDVGGQRNERKKWIHCFENVTAVMFVAAISEFDQVLFEDYTQNRFTEALKLFKEIVNSKWFEKTAFILFLNKEDLFREKILTKNINESKDVELREFKGDCRSFEETTSFIKQLFLKKKLPNPDVEHEHQIHAHVTCATDTELVRKIFENVKTIIINHALSDAGINF